MGEDIEREKVGKNMRPDFSFQEGEILNLHAQ